MTNNQDARPFVDLKKDAEEFRMKFDEDVKECLSFLDAKITSLICDPDCSGTGRSLHQNALAEFSKAKYDIFISMKSLINMKEREWLDYIAEMKKLFIENVEIFLAGTKLEVKLPSLESSSSHVLGSSFQQKDAPSAVLNANVGDKTQFNRRGRLSTSSIKSANTLCEEQEMENDEAELNQNVANKIAGRSRRAVKSVVEEETYEPGPSKSPKKVTFSADHSSSDELDIQAPLARHAKSASRRKTLLPNLKDIPGSNSLSGNPSRSKAKRKTISGVAELEKEDSSANDNLLESDGNYSEWMFLRNIDGKIPTRPSVYELKVWRAKKSAYIGSCESLRQKLTLYNLKQNSGHKHLDKYIDRNYNDIQVRYESVSSFDDAKDKMEYRIKNFAAQYNVKPAYN